MSDTNRVGLRYFKSSARTFPIAGITELQALRIVGTPNLAFVNNSVRSNEIRSDGQVSDSILVGADAGGDISIELSFGAFDDMIESAMFGAWVNAPRKTGASEITATGAGTVTVDDASDFQANHVVRLNAVTGVDIGKGVYYVASIATNTLTLTPLDASTNAITGSVVIGAASTLNVIGLRAAGAGDLDIDVTGSVMSVTAPASFFSDAMGAGSDLVPGQMIKLSGFDTAANNVWGRIVSVAATTITIVAPTGAITEAATGNGIVFFGDYVRNGVIAISAHQYGIERRYEDHSPVTRELFTGMVPGQFALNLVPQQIATGTLSFQGFNASAETTVGNLYSGGTPTDLEAPAFDVYNTSTDVGVIAVGADPVAAAGANYVLESTININTNLRRRNAVGVFGAVSIGRGEFTVSGNLNTYFDDKTLLDQIIANTDTSYTVAVANVGDGRSMVFDMPRIKLISGAPEVAGKNQDVVMNIGYDALRDPTLGYTMQVQRHHFTQ